MFQRAKAIIAILKEDSPFAFAFIFSLIIIVVGILCIVFGTANSRSASQGPATMQPSEKYLRDLGDLNMATLKYGRSFEKYDRESEKRMKDTPEEKELKETYSAAIALEDKVIAETPKGYHFDSWTGKFVRDDKKIQ